MLREGLATALGTMFLSHVVISFLRIVLVLLIVIVALTAIIAHPWPIASSSYNRAHNENECFSMRIVCVSSNLLGSIIMLKLPVHPPLGFGARRLP